MKIYFIFILALFLSCNSKTKFERKDDKSVSSHDQEKVDTIVLFTENDTVKVLSGDWKNTFDMYSKLDSVEINNKYSDPFVKMLTINNQKVGIVLENSLLKLYHLKNGYF